MEFRLNSRSKIAAHLTNGITVGVTDTRVWVLKKRKDHFDDFIKFCFHDFGTTFSNGGEGHESSITLPPVRVCQHARNQLEHFRQKCLTTKGKGKTINSLFTHKRVGFGHIIT
eukprot:Lithocolla_globosa_v1_NODE_1739_length_2369_cov_2.648660.p2 type:complete len:113 gc:universal NODE_1739_length_2369_cov_2.648660:1010-1348(+)